MEPKATKTTWDLSPLFQGDDDPRMKEEEAILREKSAAFVAKWKPRRDYVSDPKILSEALDEYEAWWRSYGTDGNQGYYIWLRTTQDQNDPALKAKFNKIEEFSRAIQNEVQFFYLHIAKIPPGEQEIFLRDPALEKYRHFLQRAFAEGRYLLTEPEEKVLNMKAATSYGNWVQMTSGFLAKEEREVLGEDGATASKNFSEIVSLMDHQKKDVRDSAAQAFNAVLARHMDVAEAELNSVLADKKVNDELRGYKRPDEARHMADDIETDVVDAMLTAGEARFDLAQRFYTLKAALLGVPKLQYHERNVPYGKLEKAYTYEQAVGLVLQVFNGLDPEFGTMFQQFVNGGFMDAYPQKGKRSGAFCAHHLISQPTYILLNYTGKLRDVLTIAHEAGHGVNNELMRSRQHALYFDSPISTAEVASTFMEDFVYDAIAKDMDDEMRLSLMMARLSDEVSTIFRQVACYRFEQELHRAFREKGYLSKEDIGALFQKHMASYMGPAVEQSPGSENWWVYWSHIRSFFYVYSYASGLLISKALQARVRQDPASIITVKELLSAGLSDSPKTILEGAGVVITDTSFWSTGLMEVEKLLDEAEIIAGKLGNV